MITNTHDTYTNKTCQIILSKIRNQENEWKQIFSSSINRVGWNGWPQPDFVCEDNVTNMRYAIEFKPPNQTKREYLTGLGQCLGYLNAHNYSGLVLPEKSDDGFEIAEVDLRMRGPGDIMGTQQSGIVDLKLADLAKDNQLIYLARDAAQKLLKEDPDLTNPKNLLVRNELIRQMKLKPNWSRIS